MNPDAIRIQTKIFMTNCLKNLQLEIFLSKPVIYVFLTPGPYKGRSDSSNMKFLPFFPFCGDNFDLPGSGSPISDPIKSGSNPDTNSKL